MWRLRESSLNDEQLGLAVGLSGNAIRNRRAKPDLWKLSDVERLAAHFSMPSTACVQLNQTLHDLPGYMKKITTEERRLVERTLLVKINQLEAYNLSNWPVRHLLRMHHALTNAKRE